MSKEELIEKLKDVKIGEYFKYPVNLPPADVNEILEGILGSYVNIAEDWNGCDLDWSLMDDLIIDDMVFAVWGSAFSGSLVFQRKKLNKDECNDIH